MADRRIQPFTVSSVTRIDQQICLVGTDGLVFTRPEEDLNRIPQPGERLEIELLGSIRVTGLTDGDRWVFRYSDDELAAQDRAAHAYFAQPDREETPCP